MGFTDGKNVSRTIRTGFMDIFSVSHSTLKLMERCFVMEKTYMRAPLLGFCYIHFWQFNVKTSIFGTFTIDTVYV